ncbi:MAG TPA: flagellar assembly protein FliW [Syntrophomonadaceae bacterium]|nr:flagellar assembly protein FliW [Syntrophomonadaceae bacterium]
MEQKDKQDQENELDRSKIIFFAEGIPAFEEEKEYFLLPLEEPSPFFFLQSAHSDLGLFMADPFVFFPDYEIDLPDPLLDNLGAENGTSGLMVFCILSTGKEFHDTTANLLAPVIINAESRKGMQFIPEKARYSTRQPLFPEIDKQTSPAAGGGR